ncbi:hypothetical protein C476_09418 [Natrinema limicola JCM 13563]|uniref:Uncharacterized protein n=1 Tax=Natrinema limicola JCM 13563 TaxID=1230457 RepID=M0CG90_9EURY|nr:hypothetical protein C476_09418 [Natrinema limicola JCM 13563]
MNRFVRQYNRTNPFVRIRVSTGSALFAHVFWTDGAVIRTPVSQCRLAATALRSHRDIVTTARLSPPDTSEDDHRGRSTETAAGFKRLVYV